MIPSAHLCSFINGSRTWLVSFLLLVNRGFLFLNLNEQTTVHCVPFYPVRSLQDGFMFYKLLSLLLFLFLSCIRPIWMVWHMPYFFLHTQTVTYLFRCYISLFSCCCYEIPTKRERNRESVSGLQQQQVQSIMVGRAWWWNHRLLAHIWGRLETESSMLTFICLSTLSTCIPSASLAHGMVQPTSGQAFPPRLIPPGKMPRVCLLHDFKSNQVYNEN